MATLAKPPLSEKPESVVVRFAGDSGDGMQLTGGQFTLSSALSGNDFATFPDFPAEIRAPQGTLFGVSAFQINFGATDIVEISLEPHPEKGQKTIMVPMTAQAVPEWEETRLVISEDFADQ